VDDVDSVPARPILHRRGCTVKIQEEHDVQDVSADQRPVPQTKDRFGDQRLRELGGDHPGYWEDRIMFEQNRAAREREALDEQARSFAPATNKLTYTGVAPDAPVTQNKDGGMQSVVEGRFDLIPPIAMFELAKVMEHGAQKYAPRNWYKIPLESHLNHLLMHMNAYLAGNRDEDHLSHVLARAAMAVEIQKLTGDLDTTP
jgi:hypothetical protein